jgi:hypothetical protein
MQKRERAKTGVFDFENSDLGKNSEI